MQSKYLWMGININIRFLCKQWDWNGQNVDCNGCTKVLEPPHTIAKPASLWFSWIHKSDKGLRADYPVLHNMKLCSFLRKSDTFLFSSLIGVLNPYTHLKKSNKCSDLKRCIKYSDLKLCIKCSDLKRCTNVSVSYLIYCKAPYLLLK